MITSLWYWCALKVNHALLSLHLRHKWDDLNSQYVLLLNSRNKSQLSMYRQNASCEGSKGASHGFFVEHLMVLTTPSILSPVQMGFSLYENSLVYMFPHFIWIAIILDWSSFQKAWKCYYMCIDFITNKVTPTSASENKNIVFREHMPYKLCHYNCIAPVRDEKQWFPLYIFF